MKSPPRSWNDLRLGARLRLLRMHYESGVGHIGGNLSCLDLLLILHHRVLLPADQFVLSKGHSAGAYYVTLWTLGKLTEQDLSTFHKDGTRLSGHPPTSGIDDILFATGSLGHGLSLAAGLALAKRLKGEPGRVFCLTSDGEWNEGSCWEALIFAKHHGLDNLTIAGRPERTPGIRHDAGSRRPRAAGGESSDPSGCRPWRSTATIRAIWSGR